MADAMTSPGCDCLECRIRVGCRFGHGAVEAGPVIGALGNVLAECLAHVGTTDAERIVAELLVARGRWQQVPRVMIQHPRGTA